MLGQTEEREPVPSGHPAALWGYPIQLVIDRDQQIYHRWGIPLLGQGVRLVLVLPHVLALWVLGSICAVTVVVTWIPILILGRIPEPVISLYVTTYRLATRVTAYVLLMAGPYPGFSLDRPYPVDLVVRMPADYSINRVWGIPFLGFLVRGLCVIPQGVILFVLGIFVAIVALVAWIPVLLTGRFPGFGYTICGGYLRLSSRITLWTLFFPAAYPAFTIES
jgi:hypothetical protein